jgi:hypothetical protein
VERPRNGMDVPDRCINWAVDMACYDGRMDRRWRNWRTCGNAGVGAPNCARLCNLRLDNSFRGSNTIKGTISSGSASCRKRAVMFRSLAYGTSDFIAEYLCEVETVQTPDWEILGSKWESVSGPDLFVHTTWESFGGPDLFIHSKEYTYAGEGLRYSLHSNEEVRRDVSVWLKKRAMETQPLS